MKMQLKELQVLQKLFQISVRSLMRVFKPKSGSHSKPLNESDQKLVSRTLRRLRPFRFTPGRKCPGFSNIDSVPVTFEKLPDMHARINQIISRLTKGLHVNIDENDNNSKVE